MFYSIVQKKIAVVLGPCVERSAGGGGFGVVHSKEDGLHLPLPKWLRMRGGEAKGVDSGLCRRRVGCGSVLSVRPTSSHRGYDRELTPRNTNSSSRGVEKGVEEVERPLRRSQRQRTENEGREKALKIPKRTFPLVVLDESGVPLVEQPLKKEKHFLFVYPRQYRGISRRSAACPSLGLMTPARWSLL